MAKGEEKTHKYTWITNKALFNKLLYICKNEEKTVSEKLDELARDAIHNETGVPMQSAGA